MVMEAEVPVMEFTSSGPNEKLPPFMPVPDAVIVLLPLVELQLTVTVPE
jgi:hypothetical protein